MFRPSQHALAARLHPADVLVIPRRRSNGRQRPPGWCADRDLRSARHRQEVHGNEALGLAVAIIVLLLAFGSVITMGLPIVTALLGVGTGMAGVGIFAGLTSVPTVSEMLAIMIGLGVGIDYALFIVTRHREHLHDGMDPYDAAGQATATAGQSVLFAGTTVVIAICGLLLAGIPAITAMGFAIGITVVASMLIAVTLLPGLLGLAGHRIDRLAIHRKKAVNEAHTTLSGKWAHHVGQRPWRYAVISFGVLSPPPPRCSACGSRSPTTATSPPRAPTPGLRPADRRLRPGLQRAKENASSRFRPVTGPPSG